MRASSTIALGLLLAPRPSAAQSPSDQLTRTTLLREAEQARAAGDHARALAAFERAGSILMTPSLRQMLALEHEALGHTLEALDQAARCAREAESDEGLNHRAAILATCRAVRDRLDARVGRLVVRVAPGAPAGLVVRVGDDVLTPALYGLPRPLLPGRVAVEASTDSGGRREEVVIAAGQTVQLELELPSQPPPPTPRAVVVTPSPPPPPPPPPPPAAAPPEPRLSLALGGGFGATAVGVDAGLVAFELRLGRGWLRAALELGGALAARLDARPAGPPGLRAWGPWLSAGVCLVPPRWPWVYACALGTGGVTLVEETSAVQTAEALLPWASVALAPGAELPLASGWALRFAARWTVSIYAPRLVADGGAGWSAPESGLSAWLYVARAWP